MHKVMLGCHILRLLSCGHCCRIKVLTKPPDGATMGDNCPVCWTHYKHWVMLLSRTGRHVPVSLFYLHMSQVHKLVPPWHGFINTIPVIYWDQEEVMNHMETFLGGSWKQRKKLTKESRLR